MKKIALFFCLACALFFSPIALAQSEKTVPAPDFTLKSLSGEEVSLSQHRGKYVLVNFWATWCGPCRFEMPEIQALHESLGDKLAILAIDLDETRGEVIDYKEDLGLTFPTVIDDGQKVWEKFSPLGLPSTYILDADGVIRAVKLGPFVSQDDISKSLQKVGLEA